MRRSGLLPRLAIAAAALSASAAAAEQVDLISIETGFVLSGDLIRFDDGDYVIRSSIGQLTVEGDSVVCEGPGCPATNIFQSSFGVFGSNAIGATLMPELIEAYSDTQGASVERVIGGDAARIVMRLRDQAGQDLAEIDLRATGSSEAFPGLISGDAIIGMSSRPVSQAEYAALESAGIREITRAGTEHVLALDGLIVIVSHENPAQAVATQDLAAIFSGEVTNWSELGGVDAPINLYVREPGSGAYDTFMEAVMDPAGLSIASDAVTVTSSSRLSDAVANDPYGIGVTSLAFERNAKALALETACGLVIEPSEFNVKTEEYPLSRRLFLYTTGAPLPASAKGLLDYALSDGAQDQIANLGFVDQSISRIPLNHQGRRIAEAFILPRDPEAMRTMSELALEVLDAARLSTTLRFQANSSVLDVKSRDDIGRLARHLSAGGEAGREVLLIGFADDAERFESNIALSRQRARQIRAELEAAMTRLGGLPEDVAFVELGYADLAPVACGEAELGGVSNRRVEVWVREPVY